MSDYSGKRGALYSFIHSFTNLIIHFINIEFFMDTWHLYSFIKEMTGNEVRGMGDTTCNKGPQLDPGMLGSAPTSNIHAYGLSCLLSHSLSLSPHVQAINEELSPIVWHHVNIF